MCVCVFFFSDEDSHSGMLSLPFFYFTDMKASAEQVIETTVGEYIKLVGRMRQGVPRTHFQLIKEEDFMRPVFDFDVEVDNPELIRDAQTDLETRALSALGSIFRPPCQINMLRSPGTVTTDKGKTKHKVSLHVYVSGVCVTMDTLRLVCDRLQTVFGLKADKSLYSKMKKLRLVGSVKCTAGRLKDLRPLQPTEDSSQYIVDYLAVAIDPNWSEFLLQEEEAAGGSSSVAATRSMSLGPSPAHKHNSSGREKKISALTPFEIMSLLSRLSSERADNYPEWIKVAFVLKHNMAILLKDGRTDEAGMMAELFVIFSMQSDKFDGKARCLKTFDSVGSGTEMVSTHPSGASESPPNPAPSPFF